MTAPSNVECMNDTLSDNNLWLQASPVMISERQCYVEEKRTTGSRGESIELFSIMCYLKHDSL